MRRHITRALYAAVAAITLSTVGFAGAGSPATAATRSISQPGYSPSWAGYSADTRLLQFTNTHVTTYSGDRGTLTGPWATWKYIATTTGTAAGTVIASPIQARCR
ncbi:MAG TPA: hypothetical protein VFV73_05880 [Streptosporangiaceae bacterium]|nr:hypothetical protein [Streptosporangiaceae bacterium]